MSATVAAKPSLLTTTETPLSVRSFLAEVCATAPTDVKTSHDEMSAWKVIAEGRSYFVKWASASIYDGGLANDADICGKRLHPAIVRLLNRVVTGDGTLLVFELAHGEPLGVMVKSGSVHELTVAKRLRLLRTVYDALAAIADDGWVFVDFYDGNVLYDLETEMATLFDFELFERGDGYTLAMDRNYGSSRLMAPEEFCRGARIDARTNVYTCGRLAINVLCREIGDGWREGFPCSPKLQAVIERATRVEPDERYPSVREFTTNFRAALNV